MNRKKFTIFSNIQDSVERFWQRIRVYLPVALSPQIAHSWARSWDPGPYPDGESVGDSTVGEIAAVGVTDE